jgi:hypothetical protein
VKSSTLSSTVKVLEPSNPSAQGKKKQAFKMFQGGQEALKPFKVGGFITTYGYGERIDLATRNFTFQRNLLPYIS